MTELGRQYFDNVQSVKLFKGVGNVTGTTGVQIRPLRAYAESIFPTFAKAYDNSSVPPPQLASDPPKKGNLSLGCLAQVENSIHVDFIAKNISEVIISFDPIETKKVVALDIQLARRSSCWFISMSPSTCAEPREMTLGIQLQTDIGFSPSTAIRMKSRYNMQFARCDAMVFPPEKIGFLPVMFETVRIPVTDGAYIRGVKMISQNGGSVIVDTIVGVVQQPSNTTISPSTATFSPLSVHLLCASFIFLAML